MSSNTPGSFWARVDKSGDCWLWTGAVGGRGYGQLQYRGRQWLAHRLAYTLAVGLIAKGLSVCVRPDHLWLGTYHENMADAFGKGRVRRGEEHGGARLWPAAVVLIRLLVAAGVPGVVVAHRFNVNANTVYSITSGRTWSWLA